MNNRISIYYAGIAYRKTPIKRIVFDISISFGQPMTLTKWVRYINLNTCSIPNNTYPINVINNAITLQNYTT